MKCPNIIPGPKVKSVTLGELTAGDAFVLTRQHAASTNTDFEPDGKVWIRLDFPSVSTASVMAGRLPDGATTFMTTETRVHPVDLRADTDGDDW